MSTLSAYRASIKRLIEAEDVEAAFEKEGFDKTVAGMVGNNKSFRASRSVGKAEDSRDAAVKPCGRMSHSKRQQ